jgi:prepilin-type N-terminal cleavage/methylation domain-containing protein
MKKQGTKTFARIERPAVSSRKTVVRGFTLVELLVVIGIMAILIAFALPSFVGIGRGSKMSSALLEVRSTLTLARQWAITHRESTYVVFPQYLNDTNKANRAIAVYGAKTGNYVSQWIYLPDGVIIAQAVSGDVFDLGLDRTGLPGFKPAALVKVLQFTPGGTARWNAPFGGSSSVINLYLTEGWVNPVSGGTDSKPNAFTNELEISGLTGIARYRSF